MGGLGWALVGWCGTKYPGWWKGPKGPPEPEPWWRDVLFGVIGAGVAVAVSNSFGGGLATAGLFAEGLIAFAAGAVSRDVAGAALGAIGK
jgi:hypothetical protein